VKVTVQVGTSQYTLDEIKARDAKELFKQGREGMDFNAALILASLKAASTAPSDAVLGMTEDDVLDLPFYTGFSTLLEAAQQANGLVPAKPGEAPGAAAADSAPSSATATTE
jgi:hypothetical protein